jgi:folylpolyglutamate synthase/dihydropteroate synthase
VALAEYLGEAGVAPIPLVLAVMKDKDVDAIVTALAPVVSSFIATEVDSPRALPAADLAARIAARCPTIPVSAIVQPDTAVGRTLEAAARVVVAGSIFLAGPLRARLIARGATHVVEPA